MSRDNNKRVLCSAMLTICAPVLVFAAGEKPESILENVVVTGTFTAAPSVDLTAIVDVIDSEEISSLNKRSVTDLLRTVAGVSVEEQGGAGGLVAVSLRGGESNFTVVMIDGVQVNDPTNTRGGSYDFGNLSIEGIDRIEIVKGPLSTVYGSDALSGVINIITKRPKEGQQHWVNFDVGEYGYRRAGFTVAGIEQDNQYKLSVFTSDGGNSAAGSGGEKDGLAITLGTQASDHGFKLDYYYTRGDLYSYPEESGGPVYAEIDDLYVSDFEEQAVVGTWKYESAEFWRSDFKLSRYTREASYQSPGIDPFTSVPPNGAHTDFSRQSLLWVNRVGGDNFWVNAGADYRREDGSSEGEVDFGFIIPTAFELDRRTQGYFIDLNGRINDSTLMSASARYDDSDSAGSESTYKIGLRHALSSSFILSANWGQAYKLPSFFALGESLTGNPNLLPETAESWDINGQWQNKEHSISITYFNNYFEELVTFDNEQFINVNSSPIKSDGMELQWDWQPDTRVSIGGNLSYTVLTPEDDNVKLNGRPKWKGNFVASWTFFDRWMINANYQYTGEQYSGTQHLGEGTIVTLSDYHRLDLAVKWQVSQEFKLRAALENSLDENYQTAVGFPAQGRTVRLGISYSLD